MIFSHRNLKSLSFNHFKESKCVGLVPICNDLTIHWTLNNVPIISGSPLKGTNLAFYNPLKKQWLDGPDLLMLADKSLFSNWPVFYCNGDYQYCHLARFSSDSDTIEDVKGRQTLDLAVKTLVGKLDDWLNTLGEDNLVYETDGMEYDDDMADSFNKVVFQVLQDVLVMEKTLVYLGIPYHHIIAFHLPMTTSNQSQELVLLWHKLLDYHQEFLNLAVTDSSVVLEMKPEPDNDGKLFFALDLQNGNTRLRKLATDLHIPTFARSKGEDGRFHMPRSRDHIFTIKDGCLWAWHISTLTLSINGLQHPSFTQIQENSFQVSENGDLIFFLSKNRDLVVFDLKALVVENYDYEVVQDPSFWLICADEEGRKAFLIEKYNERC